MLRRDRAARLCGWCFCRPKTGSGAVNLDAIDSVMARLHAVTGDEFEAPVAAAAAPGDSLKQRRDLFRNLRVETSLDNAHPPNQRDNNELNVQVQL